MKRKRKGKIWFFVVVIFIALLTYTTIAGASTRYGDTITPVVRGVEDIRFGIDIRGGVEVAFVPSDGSDATSEQMDGAQAVIESRLIALGVTDYEIYKDLDRSRIIVRFPWQAEETEFNPEEAIQELSTTGYLTFYEGYDTDAEGNPIKPQTTDENGNSVVDESKLILTGSDVASATATYGYTSGNTSTMQHYVQLSLNETGATKFGTATTALASSGGSISIWMDDEMISAPTVNEPITDGVASISGSFDADSAKSLADTINAGSLPYALMAESYSTISPTLGSRSLEAMVIAGLVALGLVCLFMILNYRLVGFVASISLIGQIAATLALISRYFVVFNSFTLTLPGIAGIILAIGMGVDANVIVAERIKEELRSGKKLDAAIKAGFSLGLRPVIDGNITVIIVAAILMGAFGPSDSFFSYLFYPIFFAFGTSTAGSIYAFGYTLLVGVVLNFVFGIFCTRVMITALSKFRRLRNVWLYNGLRPGKKAKPPRRFNFIRNRKKFFILSASLFVVILIGCFVFGVNLDVEFRGGAIVTYSYEGEIDTNELQTVVSDTLGEQVTIQTGENPNAGNTVTITLPGSQTLDVETLDALSTALTEKYPDASMEQLEVTNVVPTIGRQFLLKSIIAVVAAVVLILIYIAIRFRKIGGWLGGMTAVVALIHDLIIVFGVYVLMGVPLSGNFIAVLLTILGYSINDTVVIYDRVRENRALYGKKQSFAANVNLSINQSLRRSIMTSLTTIMALTSVCVLSLIYGLTSLFTFVFPLAIGMISGVYSTVCIAGPLWVMWENKRLPKGKRENLDEAPIGIIETPKRDSYAAIKRGDMPVPTRKGKKQADEDAEDEEELETSRKRTKKADKTKAETKVSEAEDEGDDEEEEPETDAENADEEKTAKDEKKEETAPKATGKKKATAAKKPVADKAEKNLDESEASEEKTEDVKETKPAKKAVKATETEPADDKREETEADALEDGSEDEEDKE